MAYLGKKKFLNNYICFICSNIQNSNRQPFMSCFKVDQRISCFYGGLYHFNKKTGTFEEAYLYRNIRNTRKPATPQPSDFQVNIVHL